MYTLEKLIYQKTVYLHQFKSNKDVLISFEGVLYFEDREGVKKETLKHDGVNILFASYGDDNYSGEAWVLFEKEGKLYEINGSHCSCYGLEDQWQPEEVNLEELEHRLLKGTFGTDSYSGNEFKDELKEFLGIE